MDMSTAPSYRGYRFPREIIAHCVWQGISPSPAHVNVGLIRAVACARRWHTDVLSGKFESQPRLAKELGVSARYLRKIIPCAFLAPDIVETILEGRQPSELTLAQIVDRLPTDWGAQRRRLGFTAPYASADGERDHGHTG